MNDNWKGKPEFKPYLLSRCISLLGTVFFIAFVYGICYTIKIMESTEIHWWGVHAFSVFMLGQALYSNTRKFITFQNLIYEVSKEGIKIRKGKNGEEVKSISHDAIQFIESKPYFSDKLFGTQTIRIYTGQVHEVNDRIKKKFDELENISDYKEVMSILNPR